VVRGSAPPDLEAKKIRIPKGCQNFSIQIAPNPIQINYLYSFQNFHGISATPPGYAAFG
jgi:hypothetical protein